MPKVKAVIFDVDGTLIDSVDEHAEAWVEAFREFGHNIPFKAVRDQIGKGGDQLMPVFLSKTEIDRIGKALEKRNGEIFKTRYMDRVPAFPEVRALFQRVLGDGKQVALASSAKPDQLKVYEQRAHIEDLIQAETSAKDAKQTKPHPDIIQAALDHLHDTAPAEVIMVGDTPWDAEAAGKAGLRTIGVLCGGWPAEALKRAGCIAVFQDPADLLARYDSSPLAG